MTAPSFPEPVFIETNGIRMAVQTVENGVIDAITQGIIEYGQ